jgi:hypothetical protein
VFLEVDDCRARFDELVAKGVEVVQEPMERFYGIDAAFPRRLGQPGPDDPARPDRHRTAG